MNRTGFVITIFFIIGILIGYYLNLFWYILLSILVLSVISFLLYKKFKCTYVITLPVFVIFGIIRLLTTLQPTNDYFESIADNKNEIIIFGNITDLGKEYDSKYAVYIETEVIQNDKVKISHNTYIRAIISNEHKFNIGDKIKLSGQILKLNELKNPAGFDENLYYKTRGIEYKIYPKEVYKIGETINLKIILNELKNNVLKIYKDVFDYENASLITAIITGDKTDLPEETKELFSRAGIYHIIAISGLHIHLVAFFILFLFEKFHKRYGKIFAIFFVILYCIFTGMSISAIRSTIMFLIYIVGKFIYRESDNLTSLSLSAFFILIYQPLYLFDLGFQLSFGAVLSLIIFTEPLSKLINKFFSKWINYKTSDAISSVISVCFITKLILWNNFYSITTLDFFANLIIIPLSSLLMLFGFIVGIAGFISIELAEIFAIIPDLILNLYKIICYIISQISLSHIIIGKPTGLQIISYICSVSLFALFLYNKIKFKDVVIFFCIIILVNIGKNYILEDKLNITMLDVGQGDCFVINKDDKCVIIDGGGGYDKNLGEDTGTYTLYPYLKFIGENYVDAVFITHLDVDHAKGIIEILDYIDIGKIYISDFCYENDLYKILTEKAKSNGISIIDISKGDTIKVFADVKIDCLYPKSDNDKTGNLASNVLKISYKNNSFLFTGDIDAEIEKEILNENIDINADVLKLSHHGSKYSNCQEFIDRVNPKFAIVSAGNFNRYGHPAKEVLKRFSEKYIKVFNTNEKGAVTIYSDGEKIYFETMK